MGCKVLIMRAKIFFAKELINNIENGDSVYSNNTYCQPSTVNHVTNAIIIANH